jgi:hypothetical protein
MSVINLIYGGVITPEILEGMGLKPLKGGLYSLKGDGHIKRWHVRKGYAKAFITSYIKELNHNFGNYTAWFERQRYSSIREPRTLLNVTGRRHPHFSGQLCWGNMTDAKETALSRHDIETAAGLAGVVLNNYNPRGAYSGWWTGSRRFDEPVRKCVSCGTTDAELTCIACSGDLCGMCARFCTDENSNYCPDCARDYVCTPERAARCRDGEYCAYRRGQLATEEFRPVPPSRRYAARRLRRDTVLGEREGGDDNELSG